MKKDNNLMAMLSIWGTILVVMGHSGFTAPAIYNNLSMLHDWIYSFHMPVFFFISGYLYSLTNKSFREISIVRFLTKKISRLLVPYIVLGVIIFFIKFLFSGLSSASRDFSIESFFYMFLDPRSENSTMGYLWYLITLFFVFVIVSCLQLMGVNLKSRFLCFATSILSWTLLLLIPRLSLFNFSAVLWYLPFLLFGIAFQNIPLNTKTKLNFSRLLDDKIAASILLALSIILFVLVFCLSNDNSILPSFINRVCTAIIGLLASIILCFGVLKLRVVSNLILPFAFNTYCIYLLAWFAQYPVQIVCLNILKINWLVSFALIFLFGLTLPIVVHRMVSRFPLLYKSKIFTLSIGF